MPTYKAPVRDMRFLMNEVLDFEGHYKTFPEGEEATPDMVEAIIGEMAKLCENTIAPLYQSGDEEGCEESLRRHKKSPSVAGAIRRSTCQLASSGHPTPLH